MGERRSRARMVLLLYLFSSLYLIPVYPHFASANELAHWVSVAGLAERGTLDERWAEPLVGRLVDSTRSGDAIHSNKPPGLALLASPGYFLVRLMLGPPDASNLRWYLYGMKVFGATLPCALLGWLFLARGDPDPFILAAIFFASSLYIYGALLFSHALAALLVYAAYRALFPAAEPSSRFRQAALAGAALGFACLTEFTAAVAVLVFGATLLAARRGRAVAGYVAGGAPFLVALGLYNRLLFGSFITLSRSHEAWFDTAAYTSHGLWGIGLPGPSALADVLFSPGRGLFFYSPVLLLGAAALWPRRGDPDSPRRWARFLTVALTVLVIAGYPAHHGGWGAGSRYLVIVVPLLADALLERREERGAGPLSAALLAASVVLCVVPMMTFVFAPPEFRWVHAAFDAPLLARGFFTPNGGAWLLPAAWSLLPAAAAAAAALVLALRGAGPRGTLGALAGLAAAGAIVFWPVRTSPFLQIERQVVVETYFRPEGVIAALAKRVRNPEMARQLRGVADSIRAARAYPPDDWPYLPRRTPGAARGGP